MSEADLNGRWADPSAARVLVVCSKYETGYDDPRLTAMFVDRWAGLGPGWSRGGLQGTGQHGLEGLLLGADC